MITKVAFGFFKCHKPYVVELDCNQSHKIFGQIIALGYADYGERFAPHLESFHYESHDCHRDPSAIGLGNILDILKESKLADVLRGVAHQRTDECGEPRELKPYQHQREKRE